MRKQHRQFRSLLCAFSVVAVGSVCAQQVPPPQQWVPDELKGEARHQIASWGLAVPGEGYKLDASINPDDGTIRLLWTYFEGATQKASLFRTKSVNYMPTAVARVGETIGEFYVGGTTVKGFTRVMRYAFAEPLFDGTSLVGGELIGFDVVYSVGPGTPARNVYNLLSNRVNESEVFVEFWSNHELYSLDVDSGDMDLVASPTPVGGALEVPALNGYHEVVYSVDHSTNGWMYVFANRSNRQPTYVGTPILRDLDRDGDIDDFIMVTKSNSAAYNLGNN